MKIKRLGIIFIILCLFSKAFAQESEISESVEEETSQEELKLIMEGYPDEPYTDFLGSSDFILQLSPGLLINPYAKELHSGPSAPIYAISMGFIWPNYTLIAVQPSLSYFYYYNLWYDGKAYPAEVENRTATTHCLMLELPAVISIYPGKNKIEFSLGIDILARYSLMSMYVKDTDNGGSGSAGEDVKLINKWSWQGGRYLYAKTGVCWQRELTDKIKGGPFISFYLPIGSLINSERLLGAIVSLGVKLSI